MIVNEDPRVLARKIIKFEDLTKKSGEYQKKLEDEVLALKKQLKNKLEQEELMKQEIMKTRRNYNSLKASYQKLNDEYLGIVDQLNDKKTKKREMSKSLKSLELQLTNETLLKSKNLLRNPGRGNDFGNF